MAEEENVDIAAEIDEEEVVEISDSLEKIALYAFDEARQKLEEAGEFAPFTILLQGDNLYIETHPGDDTAECFESARKTVLAAQDAIESYVFCYDGYVEMDEGEHDAIIAEAADRGQEEAFALCLHYHEDGEGYAFHEGVEYLGETPCLFDESRPADVEDIASADDGADDGAE